MIQGLTTGSKILPVDFFLKKGAKKKTNRPGADLDYFRIAPLNEEDSALEKAFYDLYGARPRRLNVLFPFDDVERNWSAWMEEWGGSGLTHRCDGGHLVEWVDGVRRVTDRPCPYAGLSLTAPKRGCKPHGNLLVLLPDMMKERLPFTGMLLTTSLYDVRNLDGIMDFYGGSQGPFRGRMRGAPFILSRRETMVPTPMGEKRARAKKWMIHLELDVRYFQRVIDASEKRPLAFETPTLQASSLPWVDTNTGEVFDSPQEEELDPQAFSTGLPAPALQKPNPHFTPQEPPQEEDATSESDNATLLAEMELLVKSINAIRLSAIDRGKLTIPQFETICHQHLGRGISLEDLDATTENVQKMGALWDSMRRFEVAGEKPEEPTTTGGGRDHAGTKYEYATLRGRIEELRATTEDDHFTEVLTNLGKAKTLSGIPPTKEGIERLKAILEALEEGEGEESLPLTEEPTTEKQGVLL